MGFSVVVYKRHICILGLPRPSALPISLFNMYVLCACDFWFQNGQRLCPALYLVKFSLALPDEQFFARLSSPMLGGIQGDGG